MYRKFEINRTKIKAGCETGRKVAKSDLPLVCTRNLEKKNKIGNFWDFETGLRSKSQRKMLHSAWV